MPLATEMECAPGGSSSPTASPAPAIAESDPVQKIRSKNVPRWKDTNIKLYYSPLACSLADHIALLEAGAPFEGERVDARTKQTASGGIFNKVTRKGYVPALVLDNGEILTENIVLDWLASQYPTLGVPGKFGRTRLLEALAFISTEIHRSFKPMWHAGNEDQRSRREQPFPRYWTTWPTALRATTFWRGAHGRRFLSVRDAVVGSAFRRLLSHMIR
jgi:glutathione S-transferase